MVLCFVSIREPMSVPILGHWKLFSEDVLLNRIAEKLKISFVDQLGRNPGHGEINAWRNSLQSFAHLLSHFGLQDVGVVLQRNFLRLLGLLGRGCIRYRYQKGGNTNSPDGRGFEGGGFVQL